MTKDANARLIYLDHSATTPVDEGVAKLVHATLLENWGNPSSRYRKGNDAKLALETAREQVAGLLGAEASDLFFTSGGTEADNLALFGTMLQAREEGRGDHLIVSSIEHSAVLKAAERLEADGFRVTRLPVGSDGIVEPDEFRAAIDERTVLASVMHVNNELGTIQPVARLAGICRERGVLFHTDAVQSYGKVPLNVQQVPVDMVSVSSHKIYGPKGVGAFWIRPGLDIRPRQYGGGQEKGLRTGTENMPGIVGFGEAARLCAAKMDEDEARIGALRDKFLKLIRDAVEEGVEINGSLERRLYANLNLRFDGVEGESLLLALDLDGIAVSTGSACSSGSTNPSHVLLALGLTPEQAHSSLRLTLGRGNSEDDLRYAAERIGYHVNRLRALAW